MFYGSAVFQSLSNGGGGGGGRSEMTSMQVLHTYANVVSANTQPSAEDKQKVLFPALLGRLRAVAAIIDHAVKKIIILKEKKVPHKHSLTL